MCFGPPLILLHRSAWKKSSPTCTIENLHSTGPVRRKWPSVPVENRNSDLTILWCRIWRCAAILFVNRSEYKTRAYELQDLRRERR